jgi:hypothetical protein
MCHAIYVSPLSTLSDPNHAVTLAAAHKPTAPTANLAIQRAMSRIDKFALRNGGSIFWSAEIRWSEGNRSRGPRQKLDVKRMERAGEATVFDCEGNDIYLTRDFKDEKASKPKGVSMKLIRIDDAWRAGSRRTMKRLYDKVDVPSLRAVDRRLLPMMFWLDASWQLLLQGEE